MITGIPDHVNQDNLEQELTAKEVSQIVQILIDGPINNDKISWYHLAEELGMPEIRQTMKMAMRQGYIFSMTEGFIDVLDYIGIQTCSFHFCH